MKTLKTKPAISVLLLLFMWYCMSSGELMDVKMVKFQITNKCSFTIWPASAPNAGQPVIADSGFLLASGQTKRIKAPNTWSGRFWARTGCNFNVSTESSACQTGDCQGQLSCNGTIGLPPATLIEVTLEPNMAFYDVSLVDGYNLPVSVTTKPANSKCSIEGCKKSVNSVCPKALQVLDESGQVIACKSACQAYNSDFFCCRESYGKVESCKDNVYTDIFKNACPSYFSYAFDTPPPLVQCSSREYVITFCPSKWSTLQII